MIEPKHDAIGLSDMLTRTGNDAANGDRLAEITFGLVNVLGLLTAPIRTSGEQVEFDGPLVTALVTFAGCIHGELMAMGLAPDVTEEALHDMLITNFTSGQHAGREKVGRIAAQQGVDPTTGRAPE